MTQRLLVRHSSGMWLDRCAHPRPPQAAVVLVALLAAFPFLPTRGQASASGSPLPAVRGRTIAIDPGHNGQNKNHPRQINRLVNAGTLYKPCDTTGTATATGYTEAAYNFDVALRLAAVLRLAGAHVVLTRHSNDGWGPCITNPSRHRQPGTRGRRDLHPRRRRAGLGPRLSRHLPAQHPGADRRHRRPLVPARSRRPLRVSSGHRDAFPTYIGRAGLERRSDLGGLNLSDVPKVFIETGNMRNSTDARLLTSSRFREREAYALAAGLDRYLAGN